jgi:hypothetical protein
MPFYSQMTPLEGQRFWEKTYENYWKRHHDENMFWGVRDVVDNPATMGQETLEKIRLPWVFVVIASVE